MCKNLSVQWICSGCWGELCLSRCGDESLGASTRACDFGFPLCLWNFKLLSYETHVLHLHQTTITKPERPGWCLTLLCALTAWTSLLCVLLQGWGSCFTAKTGLSPSSKKELGSVPCQHLFTASQALFMFLFVPTCCWKRSWEVLRTPMKTPPAASVICWLLVTERQCIVTF